MPHNEAEASKRTWSVYVLWKSHASGVSIEGRRLGLSRVRIIEIAFALLLSLAALLFVALTLWAA
jgi:hypothetical protein